MTPEEKTPITVKAVIVAPIDDVWNCWTTPAHIINWNHASDDWHSPRAVNDLRQGGSFSYRMEAKDGSMGFDFDGVYAEIIPHQLISYTIGDGRKVSVAFQGNGQTTTVTETFEAENTHSRDLQQAGWQAILDNFKKYVEKSRS